MNDWPAISRAIARAHEKAKDTHKYQTVYRRCGHIGVMPNEQYKTSKPPGAEKICTIGS
jgi:hypothetical protein